MMKIFKICERRLYSYYLNKVLFICCIPFVILDITFRFFIYNEALFTLFEPLALSFAFLPVVSFPFKLREGYIIEEDGIYYRYRFLKHKLFYKDIKCIIFSNAVLNNNQLTKGVWVTIIGGEQNEILEYCLNSCKTHVLTSYNIQHKLGAAIGFYHPGNIWEMFRRGSASILNYDFMWNKREMHKIFEGFQGDFYVAASVVSNYKNEFHDIINHYDIAADKIKIIDDSTDGKFVWRLW